MYLPSIFRPLGAQLFGLRFRCRLEMSARADGGIQDGLLYPIACPGRDAGHCVVLPWNGAGVWFQFRPKLPLMMSQPRQTWPAGMGHA